MPCARHSLAASEAEAWRFAEEVGYPRRRQAARGRRGRSPPSASDDAEALGEALQRVRAVAGAARPDRRVHHRRGALARNHLASAGAPSGTRSRTTTRRRSKCCATRGFSGACCCRGRSTTRVRRHPRAPAARALEALGMDTGLTHMEWFRRADGSVAISEVGGTAARRADHDARLARARLRLPARVGARDGLRRVRRRPSAATRRARPSCAGRGSGAVRAVHGLEQAERELGHLVTDVKLPQWDRRRRAATRAKATSSSATPRPKSSNEALLRLISIVRVELG